MTTIKVSKMTLNFGDSFMYFKILVILSARMKVVVAPKSTLVTSEMVLEIIEAVTINRSNLFPVSLKYPANPKAIYFDIASQRKTIAKV